MSFLTVAGIVIRVHVSGASESAPDEVGGDSRAFAGNLRSTGRAEKRNFQFTSPNMTLAAYETLYAAVNLGKQVACSGDMIPTTNYRVRLTRSVFRIRGSQRCTVTLNLKTV